MDSIIDYNMCDLYRKIYNYAPLDIFILSNEGTVIDMNYSSVKDYGVEVINKPIESIVSGNYYEYIDMLLKEELTGKPLNKIFVKSKKGLKEVLPKVYHFSDCEEMILVFIDGSYDNGKHKSYNRYGIYDQLTDLYNRNYFYEELDKIDKNNYLPIGVIYADVNGLKFINDVYGHRFGDELIKKSAEVIRELCRDIDIVARVGGDEFVILVPNIEEKDLIYLMKRLDDACKKIIITDLEFSVAFGYSIKSELDYKIDEVINEAEYDMYRNKLYNEKSIRRKFLNGVLASLNEKHPNEKQHSTRVSNLMVAMAQSLKLNYKAQKKYQAIGLLHNIGKVSIDYSIIEKKEKLNEEDWIEIKKHPEIGYRILKNIGDFDEILDAVLYHHEKVNGSGYPEGLIGNQIPFEARVLSICDAFDSMTSKRPYRSAMTYSDTVNELNRMSGIEFDKDLLEVFLSIKNLEKL